MKLAIMQPYFFPYIGYFHLINEVEKFVIYDDVNFIKGGWINRNRILIQDQPGYINLPMVGASSFKKINEIEVGNNLDSVLNKIMNSYSKAPYFDTVFPIISKLLEYNSKNLSLHISNSIIELSDYFGLNTSFVLSSELEKDNFLKGQDKVISICKLLNVESYYNTIGGVSLYSKDVFKSNGIELKFINSLNVEYTQFGQHFTPNLSIIDVMMFNHPDIIREYLNNYELV